MRLPPFDYLRPESLEEALAALHRYGDDCRVLAGGTDLLVRMKQRLLTPLHLVSLKRLRQLAYIREDDGGLRIGAATHLADITASEPVNRLAPGLAAAVRAVGALSIQHFTGTLAGNLCQDTRCQFYNQSAFFRNARQACHKAGGRVCYAREGGSDRCHSIFQSDTAPALMALDAKVTLQRQGESRTIALGQLYSARGERPINSASDELLTEVIVPRPGPGAGSAYHRVAERSAIDYPSVSAGAAVCVADGTIRSACLVIGAVSSAPLVISGAAGRLVGKSADDPAAVEAAARLASETAAAFMTRNIAPPVAYRVKMASVVAHRALTDALTRAAADL